MGNFYDEMKRAGWKIKGKPVHNWPKVLAARCMIAWPAAEDYGTEEEFYDRIETVRCSYHHLI